MQRDYDAKGKNTIFLEHDVDNPSGLRNRLWWLASGMSGSQTLPFTVVDSGYRYANGSGLYRMMYGEMVDAALKVPPGAELAAIFERHGDTYSVHVDMTNRLRTALGYDNEARIDVLLYEDSNVIHVDRFVRQIARLELDNDIPPDGSASFDISMDVDPATKTDYSKAHILVILDYMPEGGRGFTSAQATIAIDRLATPTLPPTPTPTAVPTEAPAAKPLYLPCLFRQ
jgi:hypothetical protein